MADRACIHHVHDEEHTTKRSATQGLEFTASHLQADHNAPVHHPNLNNAAFPPVATVFHVTARSTANRGK